MREKERLPAALCFRVTRRCNARCDFCLAPPAGSDPPGEVLLYRQRWLLRHGAREIRYCGGEPSLHPDLPELIEEARAAGAKTALTTNALALPDELVALLSAARTRVKVSLHGDREEHDALVGRGAFDGTCAGVHRLLAQGVETSLQSVLVRGGIGIIEWGVNFCLERRIRRYTLLPFVARGRGGDRRDRYELEEAGRRALRREVARLRKDLGSRLDLRLLDFHSRRIPVVETDGRIVWEGCSETGDILICTIPEGAQMQAEP
ncbi:radical SAM protein [Geomonas sp. RF6]|uniref:radical SAM protein n=1 Tax=Geomonas sp. RF6 TaxID=2897342 RepID=UPI001E551FD8|nr:radical SAM protein [Geomonas sp. RF6]UFS69178.1 radical SAM protein [Geomonas sp. RF6]